MIDKLNVIILGTGNLGTDLLIKVLQSPYLNCVAFIGRNQDSKGIAFAKSKGIETSTEGLAFLENNADAFDLVFDVTTASSHLIHWPILNKMGKKVIDLTPSHIGHMVVPAINIEEVDHFANIGLISCGGQTSLPIVHVLSQVCEEMTSIEVVSCIASKSAGPGTRINIDEYVEKTEDAIRYFSGCVNVKSILILNPAEPEINMKTTIYAEATCNDLPHLSKKLEERVKEVQTYVPGYQLTVGPVIDGNVIVVSIQVKGRGDFLPAYAGNLDIISCAAIQSAEKIAQVKNNERCPQLCL